MAVTSSYAGEDVNLHADSIVNDLAVSGPRIAIVVDQITAAFVAAMWDTLTSHAAYDTIATHADVQFFRHLRNACGHDGKWNFSELKYPAAWRDKELRLEHAGAAVFGGLLKHGDVLLLIKDLDEKYFEH